MTIYLVITIMALSLLSIILVMLSLIDQSQRRKDLEASYARIQAHNNKLINELNSIQNKVQTKAIYEFRMQAYDEYKEWEKKYDQIKYCRNCLSDDIEEIYLEVEHGVPAQALKVCRSCGTKIAEYKSKES